MTFPSVFPKYTNFPCFDTKYFKLLQFSKKITLFLGKIWPAVKIWVGGINTNFWPEYTPLFWTVTLFYKHINSYKLTTLVLIMNLLNDSLNFFCFSYMVWNRDFDESSRWKLKKICRGRKTLRRHILEMI